MEIGVGRIPARNLRQASQIVDKIIHYTSDPSTLGKWRQQVYFVADDGDFNLHHRDIEALSADLQDRQPDLRIHKIYLDDYEQETIGATQRSSAASAAIKEAIETGALVVNFSGHGNSFVWTAEEIVEPDAIKTWNNPSRLPLFITATCDFGRHDDPIFQSTGEQILSLKARGGIALLSTSRPVRADANFLLNSALIAAIFEPLPDGSYPRLGDIHRITKNNSQLGVGNRSFILLGDPALRLAYPKHLVEITKINETPLDIFTDTLHAREKVVLEGQILTQQSAPLNDYRGVLELEIYDKSNEVSTLGNENAPFSYHKYNSLIFRGTVSIEAGRFQASFIIPQSISYRKGTGLMHFYAQSSLSSYSLADAASGLSEIYIGGPAADVPIDQTGPQIEAFLDDQALTPGLKLGLKPTLHLQLDDPQGIRLTHSGLTQSLSLSIDEGPPIALAHLYQSDLDSFQSGSLSYPLDRLTEGPHTLTIQASDNHGNISTYRSSFFASTQTSIQLMEVSTFPNPTQGAMNLSFLHDKGDHNLEIELQIWHITATYSAKRKWLYVNSSGAVQLHWNLNRATLKEGLYTYILHVKDPEDGTQGHAQGKIIIGY